ncbi:iron ABC transporter permease [Anaerospora hongkongensis]|uniref:FecCD family ABC transporter permease n=1 Tax=Anaerospora hongkongensis TaxID=244830 RepID=UPI002899A152|nr:iron ABC transporter permease [Anaerospora hongkongensis]
MVKIEEVDMLEREYELQNRKKMMLILGALGLMTALGAAFITIGMKEGTAQVGAAIMAYSTGSLSASANAAANKIILFLRLPRIILAMLAGVGLAIAGALMQSVTRNYLVSPFTLGVSSAAAFGASMCIVFGTGAFFESEVGTISCAFLSSILCVLVVYGVAKRIGIKPSSIVLVGIALNYLFSAMTATIEFFAKQHKLEDVVQWSFGSFNRATWDSVLITAIVVLACSVYIMQYSLKLDAVASNDDEMVKSLGINPEKLRTICGIVAVFMTSTIISFTGVIGFVGLIAPHMARLIIGNEHKFYLPFSGILGALLLLLSDTLGKLILYPVTIPVGIIVSFLGVPLFVHLILSAGKRGIE